METQPTHGTLTLNADGKFTYTPSLNYNGDDKFSYRVLYGRGGFASNSVALTGKAVNDAPVVSGPLSKTASEDSASFTISELDLLQGASDVDLGDFLKIRDLGFVSGDTSGIVLAGSSIKVTPSAYNSLARDKASPVLLKYTFMTTVVRQTMV